MKSLSSAQKAYLAGFLDGDGSIYVRLKPNTDYRYGFQVAPYIVLFQSQKELEKFKQVCSLIDLGYIRERNDGMVEYTIGREGSIRNFLEMVGPYLVMKKEQAMLMLDILNAKASVKNAEDFGLLMKTVDRFRELNYSKKRKIYTLTP
ncbi:MAG: LAGLIDADG family homing endonuclease [Candidatus Liptonbacteria bacterium]|nr:LAGLIDADG family homing endonuclease [Candidatus Liptonbacteria bacterium]